MHDVGQRDQRESEDNVRWLALLLRRIGMMIVVEVERKYEMPPSLLTKRERERREQEQRAA